jgi:hypothetical protein
LVQRFYEWGHTFDAERQPVLHAAMRQAVEL